MFLLLLCLLSDLHVHFKILCRVNQTRGRSSRFLKSAFVSFLLYCFYKSRARTQSFRIRTNSFVISSVLMWKGNFFKDLNSAVPPQNEREDFKWCSLLMQFRHSLKRTRLKPTVLCNSKSLLRKNKTWLGLKEGTENIVHNTTRKSYKETRDAAQFSFTSVLENSQMNKEKVGHLLYKISNKDKPIFLHGSEA